MTRGNNDGWNLSQEAQFKSKEISKSSVVDDIAATLSVTVTGKIGREYEAHASAPSSPPPDAPTVPAAATTQTVPAEPPSPPVYIEEKIFVDPTSTDALQRSAINLDGSLNARQDIDHRHGGLWRIPNDSFSPRRSSMAMRRCRMLFDEGRSLLDEPL